MKRVDGTKDPEYLLLQEEKRYLFRLMSWKGSRLGPGEQEPGEIEEVREQTMVDGMKTVIIPISCLQEVKADIEAFSQRTDLNGFQKWIVFDKYVLEPKLDFSPQSIIIAAVPVRLFNAVFQTEAETVTSVVEIPVTDEEVKEALSQGNDYQFYFDYWLPQKRLAVRSGLAEYGRNNICYVDGMGSFVALFAFISDMPCEKEYTWREVKNMDLCNTCNLCLESCPTGAILAERFLLDNDRCLSKFNEVGTDPFPDYIPKTAHHRIVNCSYCQNICPQNMGKYQEISETLIFSEEETALLLSGAEYETLPDELRSKVHHCDMDWYYKSLPRNLKALFDNACRRSF